MNTSYINGLTITNLDKDENLSASVFQIHTQVALSSAKKQFTPDIPVGTSFVQMFPDRDDIALVFVKVPGGVMPFISQRDGEKWVLRDSIDSKELNQFTTSDLSDSFKELWKEIEKTDITKLIGNNPKISAAFDIYFQEYKAKIILMNQPYAYSQNTVESMTSVLKCITSYDEERKEEVPFIYNHSVRTAGIAMELAKRQGLNEEEIETLKSAALLHDLGKTTVKMSLLKKGTVLTTQEEEELEATTERTVSMLRKFFKGGAGVPVEVQELISCYNEGINASHKIWERGSEQLNNSKLFEVLYVAEKIDSLMSNEIPGKSGLNVITISEIIKNDPAISQEMKLCASVLLSDFETKMAFDRNGNLDISVYQPEMNYLLNEAPQKERPNEVLLKELSYIIGRPLDETSLQSVDEYRDALKECLNGHTWKELYDTVNIKEYTTGKYAYTLEGKMFKNELCKLRDINNIKNEIDMKDVEKAAVKRDAEVDEHSQLSKRIKDAGINMERGIG